MSLQPQNLLLCTQCGGELHPDEGQLFITCPYCSSTVYVDKSQVVFHWYLAPTLDENQAQASLRRWMAGNQTVKDLDQKSQVTGLAFEYFPLWYFKRRDGAGKESLFLEPGAATSVSELRRLNLPAGDLRKYDPNLDSQVQTPNVPLEAAMKWITERQVPMTEVVERALVHIPIYTFKYSYQGNAYTAVVEAATGSVYANIYPMKAETPYRLAGGLAAAIFLCLALFPVVGVLADDMNGLGLGLLACSGLGLFAGAGLFGLAAWVAAKI